MEKQDALKKLEFAGNLLIEIERQIKEGKKVERLALRIAIGELLDLLSAAGFSI